MTIEEAQEILGQTNCADVDLATGQVVDKDTLVVYATWEDYRVSIKNAREEAMQFLQDNRDQASDIINLPGIKPLFEEAEGLT